MTSRILAFFCVLVTPALSFPQPPLPEGAIAQLAVPRFDVPLGFGVALSPNGREVAIVGEARRSPNIGAPAPGTPTSRSSSGT